MLAPTRSRQLQKLQLLNALARRCLCSTGNEEQEVNEVPPVRKAVIVSTSTDIYTNLALEHWLYKNEHLTDQHILMLWVNDPCVVIGRHQNPWVESGVSKLASLGVQLARRNSGGGTVYHDKGNLNLTFFTPRNHYNRKYNLQFIADSIYKDFALKIEISKRQDLTLRGYKISGTAAKLARISSYHHCTLLVNANTDLLRRSLQPSNWEIKTTATKSIKSKILNLSQENPHVSVDNLLKSLAMRYLNFNNINLTQNIVDPMKNSVKDTNKSFKLTNAQFLSDRINYDSLKIHLIQPTESNFPGITEIHEEMIGWKWIYGRTPKFTVNKAFMVEKPQKEIDAVTTTTTRTYLMLVTVEVENGIISAIDLRLPKYYRGSDPSRKLKEMKKLQGSNYSEEVLDYVEQLFGENVIQSEHASSVISALND